MAVRIAKIAVQVGIRAPCLKVLAWPLYCLETLDLTSASLFCRQVMSYGAAHFDKLLF
jgi:hypothetical protein